MPRIFLCYRSGDDAYAAALLDEKLSETLGREQVFRASRSIEPGESYSEVIIRALKDCEEMLVIVGPRWTESMAASNSPAEGQEQDWVRTEIATALASGARVIPLLLSRTPRLDARCLPSEIAGLADLQYIIFDHRDVERSFARLVDVLRGHAAAHSEKHVHAGLDS